MKLIDPNQPVQDVENPVSPQTHAKLAKGRATQMLAKGKISPIEKAHIDRKANHVLGKNFHNIKGN